jgi:hypothetical protein
MTTNILTSLSGSIILEHRFWRQAQWLVGMQDPNAFEAGDKIRVRVVLWVGARGVVKTAACDRLEVRVEDGGVLLASPGDLTNYGVAVRKAWPKTLKRAGNLQVLGKGRW